MGKPDIRMAVAAGYFYPASPGELNRQIRSFIPDQVHSKHTALACLLPHAGYTYSGNVAVKTLSRINIREKIILIGPNHTGRGLPFSIMAEGLWQTPLGEVEIDSALAKEILSGCRYLKTDKAAHADEHSLEVELPLLQYFRKDFTIVPISVMHQQADILKEIGKDIAAAIKRRKEENSVLIIASSDLTHYEPQVAAEKKDDAVIGAILKLDADKLMERVLGLNISMCGLAPAVIMLSAALELGASRAELVKYQTSGDVTKDKDSVVGYAGITIN
ncbi:MAG: AmmeMemoRadiSam system protein B [Candidatus Omnitrophota bacterium]